MASLVQKLSSCLALLLVCCVVLILVLRQRMEPWQRVLRKQIKSVHVEPHQAEYNSQSTGKSYTLKEATVKRGSTKILPRHISVVQKPSLPKYKLREQKRLADSQWDNPDDFWNMTYEDRSKFQRQQVDEYCRRYALQDNKRELPAKQLILHKEKKIAFCYVPKSACTTFKILLLHSQGMLPDQYLDYNKHKQPHVASKLHKVRLKALDSQEQEGVVKDYFKFIMFRHPLERLLSGYRSKMSVAVKSKEKITDDDDRDVEGDILLFDKEVLILHAYPDKYLKWKAAHESYPINITFSDFIDYWVKSESLSQNAHFNSVLRLCRPCTVRYDYYGSFKTFRSDSKLLMDRIGASEEELRPQYPKPSDELVNEYYGQLTDDQKLKVLRKLAPELKFYYMLFPPEKDTHKHILGIDANNFKL